MPRLQLTDEEAQLIEKLRVKNAADLAFNLGLEEACGWLEIKLESLLKQGEHSASVSNLIRTVTSEYTRGLRLLKRTIKLP